MIALVHRPGDDHLLPDRYRNLAVVAEMLAGDTRHLILDGAAHRHRMKVSPCPSSARTGFVIDADDKAAARLAALEAFLASRDGIGRAARPSIIEPSPYQRHRLTLLLRILDCLQQNPPGETSLRMVASEIVYARAMPERSIEWKSSSCRRQTQRLVEAARHMAAAGYRGLLNGRI